MNEYAPFSVSTETRIEIAAWFRLMVGVSNHLSEIIRTVSELTLRTVRTNLVFDPIATEFRFEFVARGGYRLRTISVLRVTSFYAMALGMMSVKNTSSHAIPFELAPRDKSVQILCVQKAVHCMQAFEVAPRDDFPKTLDEHDVLNHL